MFNLNEGGRVVMSQPPTDMRVGVNGMCGHVRSVGLGPANGDVYIFVRCTRKVMKLLHRERGGYVMYYKRLELGCFHPRIFLRGGIGFRSVRWDEMVFLMEGISPPPPVPCGARGMSARLATTAKTPGMPIKSVKMFG